MTDRMLSLRPSPDAILGQDGFLLLACRCLAALAGHSGAVTVREYTLALDGAERLAEVVGRPLAVTHVVLDSLREPPPLKPLLRDMARSASGQPEELRLAVLTAALPLLGALGREAHELSERLRDALNLKNVPAAQSVPMLPQAEERGLLRSMLFWRKDALDEVKDFALSYGQQDLAVAIEAYRANPSNVALLHAAFDVATAAVKEEIETFSGRLRHMKEQKFLAERLRFTSDAVIQQVEQRLKALSRRIALQKELFREELQGFVEDAANDVELVLRERMRTDDWLNPTVWKSFANSQNGRALQVRYGQLKRRYERQLEELQDELTVFQQELEARSTAFMRALDHRDFATLVRRPSLGTRVLEKADRASTATLVVGGVAGVGSAAAVAGGFVTATAFGAVAAPLAPFLLAPLALAGLYKALARPGERKDRELKVRRERVEAGLIAMLGDPAKAHDEALDGIVARFDAIAERVLSPIVYDARAASELVTLQEVLSDTLCRNTLDRLSKMADALPRPTASVPA